MLTPAVSPDSGPNLAGTPEQVCEQFAELSEAGMSCAIFGFRDYAKELKEFSQEVKVMPLMRKQGLRHCTTALESVEAGAGPAPGLDVSNG